MMALISSLASIAYKIQINSWDIERLPQVPKKLYHMETFSKISLFIIMLGAPQNQYQ
jgi:hypothetical protein